MGSKHVYQESSGFSREKFLALLRERQSIKCKYLKIGVKLFLYFYNVLNFFPGKFLSSIISYTSMNSTRAITLFIVFISQ